MVRYSFANRDYDLFMYLVALVGWLLPQMHADAETPITQRFKNEAPVAWSKFIELASCVEGECSAKKFDVIKGATVRDVSSVRFRINGLLAWQPISSGERNLLLCQNLEYGFIVEESSPKQWSMREIEWKDRRQLEFTKEKYCDEKHGTIGNLPWQRALAYACRGLIVNTTWLPHLCSRPTFNVVDAKEVKGKGNTHKYVQLRFENRTLGGSGVSIESGELLLDPNRYWQIVSATVNAHKDKDADGPNPLNFTIEIGNEFGLADDRLPYVQRQKLIKMSLPQLHVENICETSLSLKDRNDVAAFTLPAFGLLEPVKTLKKSSWLPSVFWINLALVFVLASVIVYRRTSQPRLVNSKRNPLDPM